MWSSNTSYWGSNACIVASNAAFYGSNASTYGSNTSVFSCNNYIFALGTSAYACNVCLYSSNVGGYGSNAGVYGSNVSFASSNAAFSALSMGIYASNNADPTNANAVAGYASNTSFAACNFSIYASNASFAASNMSVYSSNCGQAALWASNAADPVAVAGTYGSNLSTTMSNKMYPESDMNSYYFLMQNLLTQRYYNPLISLNSFTCYPNTIIDKFSSLTSNFVSSNFVPSTSMFVDSNSLRKFIGVQSNNTSGTASNFTYSNYTTLDSGFGVSFTNFWIDRLSFVTGPCTITQATFKTVSIGSGGIFCGIVRQNNSSSNSFTCMATTACNTVGIFSNINYVVPNDGLKYWVGASTMVGSGNATFNGASRAGCIRIEANPGVDTIAIYQTSNYTGAQITFNNVGPNTVLYYNTTSTLASNDYTNVTMLSNFYTPCNISRVYLSGIAYSPCNLYENSNNINALVTVNGGTNWTNIPLQHAGVIDVQSNVFVYGNAMFSNNSSNLNTKIKLLESNSTLSAMGLTWE
jgi:hypothetical protein